MRGFFSWQAGISALAFLWKIFCLHLMGTSKNRLRTMIADRFRPDKAAFLQMGLDSLSTRTRTLLLLTLLPLTLLAQQNVQLEAQPTEGATEIQMAGEVETTPQDDTEAIDVDIVAQPVEKKYPVQIGEEIVYLPFTTTQLVISFAILLFGVFLRNVVARWLFKFFAKLAQRTRWKFDDDVLSALEKPVSWFMLAFAIYMATVQLGFEAILTKPVGMYFSAVTVALIMWGLYRMVDVLGDLMETVVKRKDSGLSGFIPLFKKTARVFIVIIGTLTVVDSFGISVTPLLATFGLGGAALALASKDTISNLFGSLMIVLDRPFKVGDWIMVGDKVDGDVEEIGLRSTKVRTWPKTVISIPNSVLANEYINNWSRMPKRRVKQIIGVTYSTSSAEMHALVEDIRGILRGDQDVQQDFILVNFIDFGSSSLDILVYYFTQTTAWLPHMEVRQRINEKIMQAIEARGLSFAFPSRSLYFDGPVARKMAGMPDEPDQPSLPEQSGGGHANRNRGGNPHGDAGGEGRLPGDYGPQLPY